MKYLLFSLLMFTACTMKAPVSNSKTNNPNYEVALLFENDGCKVYRFYDERYRYYTNCGETITTHSCGKSCTYQENIGGR